MKLIDQPKAPNPRRVRIFLAEKGITIATEPLDLMKGEHRSSGFTALNPYQTIPVLVFDDGSAISESVAICRYFEELHPEPALFGIGARERADVEMWNRRIELGLYFRVAQATRHLHPAMAAIESPQVAEWGEINRNRTMEQLALLDDQLARHRFVAGGTYSIADITALVSIDFMRLLKIERPAGLAHLARWHAEVSARPSAKA
jgi:glutathione S-transferase